VIARSNEAKALGIKMGSPAFEIKDILEKNQVIIFSSNYTLYGDISSRVMSVIAEYAPKLEVYSIDEAFVELTGMGISNLEKWGIELKAAVYKATGIPVSVGVASSKTLAKVANKWVKKHKIASGVYVLDNEPVEREAVLKNIPVEDIWGVGGRYAYWLQNNGVTTAYELAVSKDKWIRKRMTVQGDRMINELRGIPCIPLESQPPAKKGICTSRSFGKLVTNKNTMREAVANFTASCARKLRREGSCTGLVQVFIHTNAYRMQDKQYYQSINIRLPVATAHTGELLFYAMWGLDRIFREGYNYKKAGVMVTNIVPQDQIQMGLFDQMDRGRGDVVMKTLDKINDGFGKDLVKFAVQGRGREWKLRQEKLSPCYTTRWEHLLKVF
jgi:DNA polymerase V